MKDLEVKLKSIEAQSTDLLSDNERLRRELDRLATQNEILRATSTPKRLSGQPHRPDPDSTDAATDPEALTADTMIHSPRAFNAAFSNEHNPGWNKPVSHRITVSPTTGERRLATGAAWDYIQNHDLYKKRSIELGEVVDRLRGKAVCDGTGPSFLESEIITAIEDSPTAPGHDELI